MRAPDNSAFQPAQVHRGDFAVHLRQQCRHCRCKIEPTAADRNAFCSWKCFAGYFQLLCLACERPIKPKAHGSNQRFCRTQCKRKFHRNREHYLGRFHNELHLERGAFKGGPRSGDTKIAGAGLGSPTNPLKPRVKIELKPDRASPLIGPRDWPANLIGGDRRGCRLDPVLKQTILDTEYVEGEHYAFDAHDRCVGTFPTRRDAMRAIPACESIERPARAS